MFDIHNIKILNFRSFAGNHYFEFPTEPGLYFLTGDNQVEPRLESNGAGKSTLLDAIYWCLYGKSIRGLKSNDIITWGRDHCSVQLSMTIGAKSFQLTRSQNPNCLLVDDLQLDQTSLQKHLLLGDDSFLYSVILPQFGQSFFELTPSNKMALFAQILGLDYWLERSQKATDRAKQLKTEITIHETNIAQHKSYLKVLDSEIESLTKKSEAFLSEKSDLVSALKPQLAKAEQTLEYIQQNSAKTVKTLEKARIAQNIVREIVLAAEQSNNKDQRISKTATKALVVEEFKLEALENQQKSLLGLGSICPTCKQDVDPNNLVKEKQRIGMELVKQIQICKKANTIDVNAKTNEAISNKAWMTARNAEAEKKIEITSLEKDLVVAEAGLKAANLVVSRLREQIQDEIERKNPYEDLVKNQQKIRTKTTTSLAEGKQLLNRDVATHSAVDFWVNGFKRLRLLLIEETLQSLEAEVNNSMTSLGLVDWQTTFDVERENKSGGVTKGFMLFVRNAQHPTPVRFEAWSGGEGQRLQLAGDLGLANLIMLQVGLKNTIEFFDEPSKHLSRAGLLDLAETLHQRAGADHKRIFLIDHHTLDFAEFAGTIKVIKTEKGSELVIM